MTDVPAKESGLNDAVKDTTKRGLRDHGIILVMLGITLWILWGWIADTRDTNKKQNEVIMNFALQNQTVVQKATTVMERVERALDRTERTEKRGGSVANRAPVIEGND